MTPLDRFEAVIFDLDGVLTRTARVHARAWKQVFDEFLAEHPGLRPEQRRAFDLQTDYRAYVDGKPRYEGVQAFLASRTIALPFGDASDPPGGSTVCAIGNRKNDAFRALVAEDGVEVFPSSVELVRRLRARGVRVALVTASRNAGAILAAARLEGLFDVRIDGAEVARLGLAGKPAPDTFLEAAVRLGVAPRRAAVIEDALAGVEAGRRGGFGLVIGVDRAGQAAALRARGADVVVEDLAEVLPGGEKDSDAGGGA